MAISIETLFKERKYPFIFTLLVLLVCVTILFFTNITSTSTIDPIGFYPPDVKAQPAPTLADSSTTPKDQGLPQKEVVFGNVNIDWKLCKGAVAVDYIPCLDNLKAIKALKSRRHMEHRERHCPDSSPHCLLPLPKGYKVRVPWPKSRDMIWYDNVPHPKLVEYKKEQNWVVKSGEYLRFPGGGTQFKEGVDHYIKFIEKTLPAIQWGKNIRVVLDVGCGVASFGGYLLDKNVITMSFAPKDEHEAQIQFALERGIPATLSVIGTQKLIFPDNGFDLIHCARCRVHWDANGGKPLFELNRILRPGGFFAWSATPVYRDDERDQKVWNAMVTITKAMCWTVVAKTLDLSGIGLVIYQKPTSSSCYGKRKENNPPLCANNERKNSTWYATLSSCLTPLPVDNAGNLQSWPMPWPQRLTSIPPSLSTESDSTEMFYKDSKRWSEIVSDVYRDGLSINWSSVRNIMDMNAGYAGFAAAIIDLPVWVMNVVPIDMPDTLSIIYDRGLIGTYHDWCESLNTYPRTYDLLHSSFLFKSLEQRCDMVDVVVEIDRILRPDGYLLVQDSMEIISKLGPVLRSLHWSITLHQNQFLVARKSFWRPSS
ncbi:probable methyltransferase PMT23 isoform X2 [Gastrolobium bilobum]|uniref:probable methyltransferase PMT23 isoform X2 n=1 Tax=Gastrolobium bilobum TaxID=150636 RepID=UPI002AB097A6|nr:probable methyltransferase PMT23 isoform X2 [Gastrolobium bilobum]